MKDTVLKKEFKKNDVQRLRNLMQGKHGDKTTTSIGYTKKQEFHKEGDIWEEDGRQWTIKNSIKQNITKLDKAKSKLHLPLFCPSCNNMMKYRQDKKFFIMFNRCFNCQIDFEGKLRVEGKFEEYEKSIINSDIDNYIKEFSIWIDEQITQSNESYITEAGDVERWVGSSKEKLLQTKQETIQYLESFKKK